MLSPSNPSARSGNDVLKRSNAEFKSLGGQVGDEICFNFEGPAMVSEEKTAYLTILRNIDPSKRIVIVTTKGVCDQPPGRVGNQDQG